EIDDLLRTATDKVVLLAVDLDHDASGARANDPHDAFHQCRLAVAVRPQQHHRLAGVDVERHVLEHAHGAIGGVDLLDCQAIGQYTPSPPRHRGLPYQAHRPRFFSRTPAR